MAGPHWIGNRCRPVPTGMSIRMKARNPQARDHAGEQQFAGANTHSDALPPIIGHLDSAVLPGQTFAVRLPANLIPQFPIVGGRYFLVRCGCPAVTEGEVDWTHHLRRPLFVCGRQKMDRDERWLLIPSIGRIDRRNDRESSPAKGQHGADAGYAWLAKQEIGDPLDLLGPFGNGFSLLPEMQNLLLLADIEDDPAWFWKLLPLCEQALDKGGRVTYLIRAANEESVAGLVPFLPVQVEVRTTLGASQWLEQVGSTLAWADQVCAGVPAESYGELLTLVRTTRFRVDRNFAQVLVNADLLCGVGACLVCVIPIARGGLTRACVHGPVFDLTDLAE